MLNKYSRRVFNDVKYEPLGSELQAGEETVDCSLNVNVTDADEWTYFTFSRFLAGRFFFYDQSVHTQRRQNQSLSFL